MNLKTILVGLDLSEMDENLIRYASLVCEGFQTEKIYFLHIAKDLELPDEVIKEYGDVLAPVDEGITTTLEKKINSNFTASTEVEIEIKEGNPVDKILRFAKIKNIDLLILGKKEDLEGSGIITDSLVRKSPCNLLLVPENNKSTEIKKILIPTDFSEHSHLAVRHAVHLGNYFKAVVGCVNIYDVPRGYSKIGKSFKEFAEIMLGHAKKNYENFISQFNDPVECNYILSKDHKYSDSLFEYIETSRPDIIFIGSKGRTDAAVVLLGSMAEKLTKGVKNVPLFIIKKKGESVNIFEALLKL